ncbi:hypothetical protein Tco_0630693 [Tanacetum coccineum]
MRQTRKRLWCGLGVVWSCFGDDLTSKRIVPYERERERERVQRDSERVEGERLVRGFERRCAERECSGGWEGVSRELEVLVSMIDEDGGLGIIDEDAIWKTWSLGQSQRSEGGSWMERRDFEDLRIDEDRWGR